MTSIEIRSGSTLARIDTAIGFNLFSWIVDGFDYLHHEQGFPPEGKPTHNGTPILFPWPNRIAGGQFTYAGRTYQLPVNEAATGASIHGYAVSRPWRVVDSGPDFATGEFILSVDAPDCQWPADAGVRVTYRVESTMLQCVSEVFSNDGQPLPFGLGFHPYFRVPGPFDQWLLQADASQMWELHNMVPAGPPVDIAPELDFRTPKRVGNLHLDDVLTGLTPASGLAKRAALMSMASTLTMRSDAGFRDYVMFIPASRDAVAIEPYTCVSNAANLQEQGIEAGWQVLPAGETAIFEWRVDVQ